MFKRLPKILPLCGCQRGTSRPSSFCRHQFLRDFRQNISSRFPTKFSNKTNKNNFRQNQNHDYVPGQGGTQDIISRGGEATSGTWKKIRGTFAGKLKKNVEKVKIAKIWPAKENFVTGEIRTHDLWSANKTVAWLTRFPVSAMRPPLPLLY